MVGKLVTEMDCERIPRDACFSKTSGREAWPFPIAGADELTERAERRDMGPGKLCESPEAGPKT